MKRVRFLTVFASVVLACISFFHCGGGVEEPIDLAALQSMGEDWKVVKQDSLPDGGFVKLNHDHWLMYFLHWRPLTEKNKNISVEYAKERMLNFWGPDMPFTITSAGGETEIGGHQAYYIDGSFANGVVQTRFIVWNCPERKRQFIADCNINTRRGTSESLLRLQYDITSTISCHGEESGVDNSLLTQKYSSDKFKLSFYMPFNWRTFEYPEPKWFPNGPSDTNGTLWTLLTDSDNYIDLIWENKSKAVSEQLFQEYIGKFRNSIWDFNKIEYSISDLKINRIQNIRNSIGASGSYRMNYRYQEKQGGETFLYRAYLRNYRNKIYFLMASIISRNTWWNRPVDLTPTDDVFKAFLKNEVLPNIPAFRHDLRKIVQ